MQVLAFMPQKFNVTKSKEDLDLQALWNMLLNDDNENPSNNQKGKSSNQVKTIKAENLFIVLSALLNIRLP